MGPGEVAAILFGVFGILIILRVPVAFALGLAVVPVFFIEEGAPQKRVHAQSLEDPVGGSDSLKTLGPIPTGGEERSRSVYPEFVEHRIHG